MPLTPNNKAETRDCCPKHKLCLISDVFLSALEETYSMVDICNGIQSLSKGESRSVRAAVVLGLPTLPLGLFRKLADLGYSLFLEDGGRSVITEHKS